MSTELIVCWIRADKIEMIVVPGSHDFPIEWTGNKGPVSTKKIYIYSILHEHEHGISAIIIFAFSNQ